MMNSNPNDNPNNDDAHQNEAIELTESLDRKINTPRGGSIDVGPNDVLCGRSKASFNHGESMMHEWLDG